MVWMSIDYNILFKISLYGLDGVLIAEVQILPTGESFINPHTVR